MSSIRRGELHGTLKMVGTRCRASWPTDRSALPEAWRVKVSQSSPLRNQDLNCKKLALARQRLGLRWPSTALALLASAQSARGLAQSKTWRTFGWFMESFNLKQWMRIGTRNRSTVPGSAGVSPASSGFRLPTGRRDAGAPRRLTESKGLAELAPPKLGQGFVQ